MDLLLKELEKRIQQIGYYPISVAPDNGIFYKDILLKSMTNGNPDCGKDTIQLAIEKIEMERSQENIWKLLTQGAIIQKELVQYIDFKNIVNNQFHYATEVSIPTEQGKWSWDMVLYVNGIPFVLLEKEKSIETASDTNGYFANKRLKEFFKYVQFSILLENQNAKYMITQGKDFKTFFWREEGVFESKEEEILEGMLSQSRLLDLVKNYTRYEKKEKKIATYYQYQAIQKTIEQVSNYDEKGERKSATICIPTGTGKTSTISYLVENLLNTYSYPDTKIVIITDRVEVGMQTYQRMLHRNILAKLMQTKEELIKCLTDPTTRVMITTIQKFFGPIKRNKECFSKNVFTIFQTSSGKVGEYKNTVKEILPNASQINVIDPNQKQEYDDIVYSYEIQQAMEDKQLVPVYYEKIKLFPEIQEIQQQIEIKNFWLQNRAEQLITHVYHHYKTHVLQDKCVAILIASSKTQAITYTNLLKKYQDIHVKAYIHRNKETKEKIEDKNLLEYYDEIQNEYDSDEQYQQEVIEELQKGQLDIVVMVERGIPYASIPNMCVLYLDKVVGEKELHTLASFVNKQYEDKAYGMIIDYQNDFSDKIEQDGVTDIKVIAIFMDTMLDSIEKLRKEGITFSNKHSLYYRYGVLTQYLYMIVNSERLKKYMGEQRIEEMIQKIKQIQSLVQKNLYFYADYLLEEQPAIETIPGLSKIKQPASVFQEAQLMQELEQFSSETEKAFVLLNRIQGDIQKRTPYVSEHDVHISEKINSLKQRAEKKVIQGDTLWDLAKQLHNWYVENKKKINYPKQIENSNFAKAIYEQLRSFTYDCFCLEKILIDITINTQEIYEENRTIDWQKSYTVKRKIQQQLEDMLYYYMDREFITLSYEQIDAFLDSSWQVAQKQLPLKAVGKSIPDYYFYITTKKVHATGVFRGHNFMVLKGSTIAGNFVASISSNCVSLLEKLKKEGRIVDNEFVKDTEISSVSTAGSIILGRNVNGRMVWKDKNKKTIKQWQQERGEDRHGTEE